MDAMALAAHCAQVLSTDLLPPKKPHIMADVFDTPPPLLNRRTRLSSLDCRSLLARRAAQLA